MNLGWLNDNKSQDEVRSVITHEFGHAFGAIREREGPYNHIPWNKAQINEDIRDPPNSWEKIKVDRNPPTVCTLQETQTTDIDPDSIILCYSPPSQTTKGTGYETRFSALDKVYVKSCYPADVFAGQFNTWEVRAPWDILWLNNEKVIRYQQRYSTIPVITSRAL